MHDRNIIIRRFFGNLRGILYQLAFNLVLNSVAPQDTADEDGDDDAMDLSCLRILCAWMLNL